MINSDDLKPIDDLIQDTANRANKAAVAYGLGWTETGADNCINTRLQALIDAKNAMLKLGMQQLEKEQAEQFKHPLPPRTVAEANANARRRNEPCIVCGTSSNRYEFCYAHKWMEY